MEDSSQTTPHHIEHALPARVAGLHTQCPGGSGSRVFLDCCARGWMSEGMGKGDSMGQRAIKRQAVKEKRETENQNQARIVLFGYYSRAGWHGWIPHSFTALSKKDVSEQIFSIPSRRLSLKAAASYAQVFKIFLIHNPGRKVFQSQKRLHFQLPKHIYAYTFSFRIELDNWDGMNQTDRAYGGKAHFTFVHPLHFPYFAQNYLD